MNEPNAAAEAIPHAAVSRRKRRFSLVWVVPIVAALIGGWLVVKALTEKGPEITIYFKSAESLEAGKTKVKYKDVDIGLVTDISFDKDFSRVRVKVQMAEDAARLVSTSTRFWVVRARVSMAAVSGIGTVFSGAYITLDPGKPGDKVQVFTGMEEPPVITSGMPGKHFVLESETLGSLEVGAPIYFRQIRVGEVVALALAEDGSKVTAKIFVHAPLRPLRSHRHPLLERERDRLPRRRDGPDRGHRVGHLDPVRWDRLRPARPDEGARRAGRPGHPLRTLR